MHKRPMRLILPICADDQEQDSSRQHAHDTAVFHQPLINSYVEFIFQKQHQSDDTNGHRHHLICFLMRLGGAGINVTDHTSHRCRTDPRH